MSYSNAKQASSGGASASGQSMPASATRDFSASQPMTGHYQAPNPHAQQPNATAEDKVQAAGHMPGLAEVQKDNEKDLRQPGEEDAAGNKIQHKGILKKMFHWEHSGMNAD